MASSLLAALAGIRAHQRWIDVIGNNLANSNTPGYKGSHAVFSDMLYQQIKSASPPSSSMGGTNPVQVGLGVDVGATERNLSQGSLNPTGRTLDVALVGNGYFTLAQGQDVVYSRVGAFGLDAQQNVVDVRTGYRVLTPTGEPLTLDVTMKLPPEPTTFMDFGGNLPAEIGGPLPQILTSSSPFQEGTSAVLAGSLAGPFTGLAASTAYTMDVSVDGGVPQEVTVTSDASGQIDLADVISEISTNVSGVSASDSGGALQLESLTSGEASTIKVMPGSGSDLAAVLGLSASLVQGTETIASSSSDLNALVTNITDYADGDAIEISGTDMDGSPVAATFVYGAGADGTTVGDLVSFLDGLFGEASVTYDAATGKIDVAAEEAGPGELSLLVDDGSGASGETTWALNAFSVSQNGTGPDTVSSSTEVYDSAGLAHLVTFEFERQEDGTWTLSADMDESSGTILSPPITGIAFRSDGTLVAPASDQISIQLADGSMQEVNLGLGDIGGLQGLTQFGGTSGVAVERQDGSPPGDLSTFSVDPRGVVVGVFTNGEIAELGQFGISTFSNEAGLAPTGNGYYTQTANSGQRVLAAGLANGAGEVVGGVLEDSNVDTAQEFVRLILAQQGFQANARVITVQDEMFSEVMRVI